MPHPLLAYAYASRAARPLSDADLDALGRQSAARNAADGVTGLLLYSGSVFVQVLEGPSGAVAGTVRRIHADDRHRGLVVLRAAPLGARHFPTWSMGLVHGERFAGFPGLDALLLPGFSPESALRHADETLRLMHALPALLDGSYREAQLAM